MKLVSWNVNGLRACLGKGFLDFCAFADADVICLQETKMRPEQAEFDLPGYERYWNSADKAGYSGTAVFTRQTPLSVTYDFGKEVHRHGKRSTTMRGGSLLWSMRSSIWCAATPPTPRTSFPGWTIAWSGRTICGTI